MVTEALVVLLLGVLLYIALRKPQGLPPGIWGLPLVGRLPDFSVCLSDQVKQLRAVYGDIFIWRMGTSINVFLCSPELIKKFMAKSEFSDRPNFHNFQLYGGSPTNGIIVSNGYHWQENRRFGLRQLRDLGMGKTRQEEMIKEEARYLVQNLKGHTNKAQPLPLSVGIAVLNVIWQMVANIRYDMNDPKAEEFIRLTTEVNQNFQGPVYIFNWFPWLAFICPSFLKERFGLSKLRKGLQNLSKVMATFIEEHQDSLDPLNPRDLIDHYLIELQEEMDSSRQGGSSPGGHDLHRSFKDLEILTSDFFVAGSDTTTSTLRWAILYLIKYPEVQEKAQREIDQVVPKGTILYYHERNKLPYLEAVIHEIHRIVSLAPFAVPHCTTQDIQINGYVIPKGSVVHPHLEGSMKDPHLWHRPDHFDPQRFLNSDCSFTNKREGFFPFGSGRRSCLGESLARVEVFVFLMALLQNFSFVAPAGEDLCTASDPEVIIINSPRKYRVIIKERQ